MNLGVPTQLTCALLPIFSGIHGPKMIMNIGSIGAPGGLPYAAVYGACRAFNHVWGKGLDAEMQNPNPQRIDVPGVLVE